MSSLHPPTEEAPYIVSPELVLVDRQLAARARSDLRPPADTFAFRPLGTSTSSLADERSPDQARAHPGGRAIPRGVARRSGKVASRVRSWHLVAGTTALIAAAVFVGVRLDFNGDRAGADPTTVGPIVEEAPVPAAPPPAVPQRFVWAPSAGASGYRVEIFRGRSRIFTANTPKPQLTMPRTWRFDGRQHRLEPGTYRWYVWPIVSGVRASSAIVQAKLVVP